VQKDCTVMKKSPPHKKPTNRLAYRVPEVAEMLALSVRKVNEMIATGNLGSVKIGRSRRVTSDHIAALLEVQ
jgi:excisionase family DNA binding protein